MVPRPLIRLRSLSSCSSLIEPACGLTCVVCWASSGDKNAPATCIAKATIITRTGPYRAAMRSLSLEPARRCSPAILLLYDRFTVGRLPAPSTGAITAFCYSFLIDLSNDFPVTGEQRLGRTHLSAQRELAGGEAV